VLDLVSGTGAFGIESLSRGAQKVVCIEKSPTALSVIKRNIHAGALEGAAQIIQWDIEKNLNCLQRMPLQYDLVFMDPPYNRGMVLKGLRNLYHQGDCLQPGASVVVEHSVSEPILEDTIKFTIYDQRKYGKTLVTFLTNML